MAVATNEQATRPFVAADLDSMPHDGRRREVIGGSLVVTPAPLPRHQWCLIRLAHALLQVCPPHLGVLVAPCDWRPAPEESYQPDLLVIRTDDFTPDRPLTATPLLLVEVLSPSNRAWDELLKRARYQALRVPAYWLVDPETASVRVLRLDQQGRYIQTAQAEGSTRLAVDFPFAVELAPEDLVRVGGRAGA